MRFNLVPALLVAATLAPALSQAEGFSYSYLEGAYINTDVDRFNKDIDGLALRGSFEITDNIFVFGGFSDQSTSIFSTNIGLQSYDIGAGYAWPLASNIDLYGRLGYMHAEADVPGPNFEDDGYLLGAGLRGRVVDNLELEGGVNYTDLNDTGNETSLALAARYFFTPQFAAGIEGEFGDNANTYGVNVRWSFGK
ncbi:MAG TPA: outer membrane beta-barrel protein [Rudaea sp.]|nr:outer membrane beta-barrel protein [Rudaea sp.]